MNKQAIIIGASSGIGYALAKELAFEGYDLGLFSRRIEKMQQLKQDIQSSHSQCAVKIYCCDVTCVAEMQKVIEDHIGKLNKIDLFVYNSGVRYDNPELDWTKEQKTIDVNIIGFTRATDMAVKIFEKQQRGHFVCISSIAGLRGGARSPAYNATKAYQINYLEGLRQKFWKTSLYFTDIRPGFVDTDMIKDIKNPFWSQSAKKTAKQIIDATKRKKRIATVTRRWRLISSLFKILPETIFAKGYRSYRSK